MKLKLKATNYVFRKNCDVGGRWNPEMWRKQIHRKTKLNRDADGWRKVINKCIKGMCEGNSDSEAEPDIVCPEPKVIIEGAVGRDEDSCCIASGMCVGNTDTETEPDIECTAPSVLRPTPALRQGRSEEQILHLV